MNSYMLVVIYILVGSPPSAMHTVTELGLHKDQCEILAQQHRDTAKAMQYQRLWFKATCRKW
jgi:hypothetical protein